MRGTLKITAKIDHRMSFSLLFNIFLYALFFVLPYSIFAQTQYLVSINPTSGAHSIISSIPTVQYINSGRSTFDEVNGRFIIVGADGNFNDSLYSIDVSSGNIVTRVPFPLGLGPNDNLSSLIFNNSDSTLYALLYLGTSQLNYLVSLNPSTGTYILIDSIPGFQSILSGTQVIDVVNQTYSFVGLNQITFTSKLYTVDLVTGSTLYSPNFPNSTNQFDDIFNLKQDSLNNLIGIFNAFNSNIYQLVTVNKTTGIHTFIDTLRGFSNYVPFNSIYNKSANLYSFEARDQNSNTRLYSYDVTTANLVSSPIFPVLADTNDNVTELQIDNSTGIIYGLHWDNDITTGALEHNSLDMISVYPNPASALINIDIGTEKLVTVELFNSLVQL